MLIKSFIKDYFGLKPVEVEVVLTSGLPQISILGLPDKVIQESAKRIQSALVAQGYHMPRARQVLVNLSPREVRKSSLGIDLAIALGILAESGQKEIDEEILRTHAVYGELTLAGAVLAPSDIGSIRDLETPVITGGPERTYEFPVKILSELRAEMVAAEPRDENFAMQRPVSRFPSFPGEVAEQLLVTAVGEHPTLLAGPSGTGKSTFAEAVPAFLQPPDRADFSEIKNIGRYFQQTLEWRPAVAPHHSISAISMVGGGVPPQPGEITRAHGGALILDELLEFNPEVQAALREPFENGTISVSKGLRRRVFPARFLALATTNLCPCGEFVPGTFAKCRCSSTQLRRYTEKLTGPFTDRFAQLIFTHHWDSESAKKRPPVMVEELLLKSEKARAFALKERGQNKPNQRLDEEAVLSTFHDEHVVKMLPECRSQRRKLSILRLARTYADLAESVKVREVHVGKSLKTTFKNFILLRDLFSF